MRQQLNEALKGLTETRKMVDVARELVDKWDGYGLLEGLKSDYDKSSMAVLLENQAKQLVQEATSTGTSANSEEWSGVALPLVRRIFSDIAAQDFVSVQPMNLPSGLVFYLDFKYGNTVGNITADQSFYGKTGPNTPSGSSAPYGVNGLYGVGRYGYTVSQSSLTITTLTTASAADGVDDWNYDTEVSQSNAIAAGGNWWKVAIPKSSFPRADEKAIRAYNVQTTGNIKGSLSQFHAISGNNFVFFVSGASGDAVTASLSIDYLKQPTDITRGDFESTGTANNPETDIAIPEINLELKSQTIIAKTRKLKAVWTPEIAQDLTAYHAVDAEAELTSILSEYISMEIDLEIIDMLLLDAVTVDYWSAKVGYDWVSSSSTFAGDSVSQAAYAYTKAEWYQTLGQRIQRVSNNIHKLTLRGGANFLVCSPTVATVIESIPGFHADTDGTKEQFAMGVSAIGALKNRWTVYKNPYMTENAILVGFRGSNFFETGAVYAPYVPLLMSPLVYDPKNFTPRKGVMTRYAKKMVRPEFYGKIFCHGLETV